MAINEAGRTIALNAAPRMSRHFVACSPRLARCVSPSLHGSRRSPSRSLTIIPNAMVVAGMTASAKAIVEKP